MKTNKKLLEIITLDAEIMECFNDNQELAVITGGKGILDKLLDIVDDINVGNCGCTNNCNC